MRKATCCFRLMEMVTKSQKQAGGRRGRRRPSVVVPPRQGGGVAASGALTVRLCLGSELRGPDHCPVGAWGRPAPGRRLLLLLLLLREEAEPAAGQERGEGCSGARGAPGPPGGAVRPRDRGAVTRSQLSPRGKVRTVSGVQGGFSVVAWRVGSRVAGTWPVATSWDFGAGPARPLEARPVLSPRGLSGRKASAWALLSVRGVCGGGGAGGLSARSCLPRLLRAPNHRQNKRKVFADWFVFIRKKMSPVTV